MGTDVSIGKQNIMELWKQWKKLQPPQVKTKKSAKSVSVVKLLLIPVNSNFFFASEFCKDQMIQKNLNKMPFILNLREKDKVKISFFLFLKLATRESTI